ncbi:MAG: hypothetical protein HC838_04685, partial [Spirulinaceae cyanobacterium RM2_2_10]|nr:hypothetical protein [Spirulinaceae cyanobacterium RM2_2_10]
YHPTWIRAAAIEALYLGRYKAVSVAQILEIWERRGQPTPHFNGDFERLICRKLPDYAIDAVDAFLLSEYVHAAATTPPVVELPAAPQPLVQVARLQSPHPTLPERVPTAERNPPVSPKPRLIPAIAMPKLTASGVGIFRSPIRIYTPPSDPSEFYARLRRFVAWSFARLQPTPPPQLPVAVADDWVLELGSWHVELDDDDAASAAPVPLQLDAAADPDAIEVERAISE